MTEKRFPLSIEIRIDWSELDYLGHVNNISFFKYIQASRVNYFMAIGLMQMHKETNKGPILASCKCDFRKVLFFPGQIIVQTRIDSIKNTSFTISHQILNSDDEIVAEAHDVIVMFDFNKNDKIPVPPELKERIKAMEGREF